MRHVATGFAGVLGMLVMYGVLAGPVDARLVTDHRNPSVGGGAFELAASPTFEHQLQLAASQTISCETRNASAGADPVLHIIAGGNASGSVAELARDDDSAGNLNARVSFRAPTAGTYLLLMRAAGTGAGGAADVYCDGRNVGPASNVGGAFQRFQRLRRNEVVLAVPLPGASRTFVLYGFDPAGRIISRYPATAGEWAGFGAVATPDLNVMIGSMRDKRQRVVRLMRNDALLPGHDDDGDKLGNELEAAIGTCSRLTGLAGEWDCSRTIDPRDTDGDGLTDADEFIGQLDAAPYQLLPRWGADPRHKDMFIEVDFMLRQPGDVAQKLSPANAHAIAAIYADPETSPLLALRNAQTLNNPDLKPGIALHFDTGVTPPHNASIANLTTYGDWGGYSIAQPVKVNGQWQPADAQAVRGALMDKRRHKLFHYALGDTASGGQATVDAIAFNLPLNSPRVAAHELGHNFGLGHFGPASIEPDANCKPNYPSLMSYAYLGSANFVATFSDGYGRAAINNVNLNERGAVAMPTSTSGARYLKNLHEVFAYNVNFQTGDVDWNRDGVIAAVPVRAYANNSHGSCEFTRFNQIKAAGLSDRALSLTRLQGRTMLAYIDETNRQITVDYTDKSLNCSIIGEPCGGPLVTQRIAGDWNRDIDGFDLQRIIVAGGRQQLLLVYRKGGALFEVLLARDLTATAPTTIPLAVQAAGDPALAGNQTGTWLAFKSAESVPYVVERTTSGSWAAAKPVHGRIGLSIGTLSTRASPALIAAQYADGTTHLIGAFPMAPGIDGSPDGMIKLLERDAASGVWSAPAWEKRGPDDQPTIGRPALAFEAVQAGAAIPGRLRLLYLVGNPDGKTIVRMKSLVATGLAPTAGLSMVAEDFDNVWFYGKGIDLLFEPGVDTSLRAAVATALLGDKGVPQPHLIYLRPIADGTVNFVQRNWDDWAALGIGLCRLRNKAGAAINCAAWDFKQLSPITGPVAPPIYTTPPAPVPDVEPLPATRAQCLRACTREQNQCRVDGGSTVACGRAAQFCKAECPQL